jgi:protein TonB
MLLKKSTKADLRRKYKIFFELSLIVSLLFLIAAFKFFPNLKTTKVISDNTQEIIKVEDVINTQQILTPPPPPQPLIPIEAPDEEVLEDVPIQPTEINVNTIPSPPPPPKRKMIVEAEPDIFVVVEKMPCLIGNLKVVYPELAKRIGVEGIVTVKAAVDENGNIFIAKIEKGIDLLNEAALEAVKQAKFEPGEQRGKPVKVWVEIDIKFLLQ